MLNGKLRNIFAGLSLAAALTACQTNNIDYGNGPLTLSDRVMAAFEFYLAHENPAYFAVRHDGKVFGFSVCNYHSCEDSIGDVALSGCARRAKGERCYLLASGRDIVWTGPISYRTGRFVPDSPAGRSFILFWHHRAVQYGGRTPVRGTLTLTDDAPIVPLSFDAGYRRVFGKCTGTLDRKVGRFEANCSKMGRVTGSFEFSEKNGLGGQGVGEDEQGRIAEMNIVPRSKFREAFTHRSD